MREQLGIANEDAERVGDLFHQKYRGSRYSFGYPACPNLEDQTQLFAVLDPVKNIGVRLTETYQLEPEQSTSCVVVHHPKRKILCCLIYVPSVASEPYSTECSRTAGGLKTYGSSRPEDTHFSLLESESYLRG